MEQHKSGFNQGFSCAYVANGQVTALQAKLEELLAAGAQSAIVFAAESDELSRDNLDSVLRETAMTVFGGIFPALIWQQQVMKCGFVVLAFPHVLASELIQDLSNDQADFIDALEPLADAQIFDATMLALVDGFSASISQLMQDLYEIFGTELNFIGGGAGSLSLTPTRCIFSNQGVMQDTALLINFPYAKSVAINHGWQPIAGPYLVTGAKQNTVESIDFKPAFTVYKEAVESNTSLRFSGDNFFDVAKNCPLGMTRIGGEYVVRDALAHAADCVSFVGELPESQEVFVLTGNNETLIEAAADCARSAAQECDSEQAVMVFDCVSRWMFEGAHFQEELAVVASAFTHSPVQFGVLCLGEIAGNGKSALEFHNKTITVGSLSFGV